VVGTEEGTKRLKFNLVEPTDLLSVRVYPRFPVWGKLNFTG